MKNPNSFWARAKIHLFTRWSVEDYPGAVPRFHIPNFGKDLAVFCLLPIASVALSKSCDNESLSSRRTSVTQLKRGQTNGDAIGTQIIEFSGLASIRSSTFARRSPGTLVKVRLLNSVETYSNAPVHAQIIDSSLGPALEGATLIGDAISDTNFDRITIAFRYVKDPRHLGLAAQISARALALDGTLGLLAKKKEGFFARSAVGSSTGIQTDSVSNGNGSDLKQIIAKVLTAGLLQEFGASTQVERNRSQVLTLSPSTIFFAELTDFFPGGGK